MSPLALLLPTEAGAVLPDGKSYPAEQIWDWGTGRAPLLATDDVLSFMRDSDPRNWPEMEALLARELRGANESVRGAIASDLRRNKAHQERRRKLADEVSNGDS